MMRIPVLGLVENYSYFQCPDCGNRHEISARAALTKRQQPKAWPARIVSPWTRPSPRPSTQEPWKTRPCRIWTTP